MNATSALFELGQVLMTSGVSALVADAEHPDRPIDLLTLLARHQNGDDGHTGPEDHAANQQAIQQGNLRVFSVYRLTTATVWIITEHDRSYTTVLLPEEY